MMWIAACTILCPIGATAALPTKMGTCDTTRVAAMEHRLQVTPGGRFDPTSGTAIKLADGGYVVSYEENPAAATWRRGDPAMICLAKIPTDCPPGDARGRYFTVTNLRDMSSLTLPDSEHGCGGA